MKNAIFLNASIYKTKTKQKNNNNKKTESVPNNTPVTNSPTSLYHSLKEIKQILEALLISQSFGSATLPMSNWKQIFCVVISVFIIYKYLN